MNLAGLAKAFFKVLHVSITIILTILAIYLSEEIWVKYAAKDTSFTQSDTEVTEFESPTLVFGFWPLKNTNYSKEVPFMVYEQHELGKDFKVSFGIDEGYNIVEEISLTSNNAIYEVSHGDIGNVKFSKLLTKYGDYYKVSANLISVKDPYKAFVKIDFNKDIPDDKLPTIEFILATESNSFGVTMWDWIDGDRISITPALGYRNVHIRPKKLLKIQKCSEQSFYKCFERELQAQDYSQCPKKCTAVSTISNSIQICNTTDEFICAYEIAKIVKKSDACLHPCSKTPYKKISEYSENTDSENAKRNVHISYFIPSIEMGIEKEYLIHDFIGMLGSIGGTLGMFIGFSFLGIFSSMLEQLQVLLVYLCFKRKSSNIVNFTDNKITMVKEVSKDDLEQMYEIFEKRILQKLQLQRN